MENLKDLRADLIEEVIRLREESGTCAIYGIVLITEYAHDIEFYNYKKRDVPLLIAKGVKRYGEKWMVDVAGKDYCGRDVDFGGMFLDSISTDSLYALIEYYNKLYDEGRWEDTISELKRNKNTEYDE